MKPFYFPDLLDLRQELQIRNRSRSPESDNNNDQSLAGKEDPNKFSIGNSYSQPRKGTCFGLH